MKEYLTDKLDILIARLMIWRIRVGYGSKCNEYQKGCADCEANKVRNWLEDFIELVKEH